MQWRPDWGLRGRMALTILLLGVLYVVFVAVLWTAFRSLLALAFFLGLFSLGQFFFSDRLALWSMGAEAVDSAAYPDLHRRVERLAQQADLPKPTVAVATTDVPNAFATGRSQSSATVCVTSGLLKTLDGEQLEGVLDRKSVV